MPQFKEVFSITWKVLAALLLICAIVGGAMLALGGISFVINPHSSTAASSSPATSITPVSAPTLPIEESNANTRRTSMPKSSWDRGMARAFRHHCYTTGMNESEVMRALGEPAEKLGPSGSMGSVWTYHLPPGKCLKYEGDTCVDREKRDQTIFFTAWGAVHLTQNCEPLDGSFYIFDRDLFGRGDWR